MEISYLFRKNKEKKEESIEENKDEIKGVYPFSNLKLNTQIESIKEIDCWIKLKDNIYRIAIFPSGNIILTSKNGNLYIYDDNFILKKNEKIYTKKISIKNDNIFGTFKKNIIKIWFFEINTIIKIELNTIIIHKKTSIKDIIFLNKNDIIGREKKQYFYIIKILVN